MWLIYQDGRLIATFHMRGDAEKWHSQMGDEDKRTTYLWWDHSATIFSVPLKAEPRNWRKT